MPSGKFLNMFVFTMIKDFYNCKKCQKVYLNKLHFLFVVTLNNTNFLPYLLFVI